jgi:hypothetical protein
LPPVPGWLLLLCLTPFTGTLLHSFGCHYDY